MLFDPKVLLLSSDEIETRLWKDIFREHAILKSVSDLSEFQQVLQHDSFDAVFCGWSFHRGTWTDALRRVRLNCPDLPVIVFSRAGGEKEWVEVLGAGGFDLLVAPYQQRSVLPLLEQAVASYEMRRLRSAAQAQKAQAS